MSVRGVAVLAAAAVAGVAGVVLLWQPSDLSGARLPDPRAANASSSATAMDVPAVRRMLTGARAPAGVGPGWSVVSWSPTLAPTPGPSVDRPAQLVMVSPEGARFPLADISSFATVRDASSDGRRVLLSTPDGDPQAATRDRLTVLDVTTGRRVSFVAQGFLTSSRFVGRAGAQVLLTYSDGDTYWGELLDNDGRRIIAFPNVSEERSAMLADAEGRLVLRGTGAGISVLELQTGVQARTLGAPKGRTACQPERWWSPTVVLASCRANNGSSGEVWLFPVSGAPPKAVGQGWRAWPFVGGTLIWNGLEFDVLRAGGGRSAQIWRSPSPIAGHERDVLAVVDGIVYALNKGCEGSCDPVSLLGYDLTDARTRPLSGSGAGEGSVISAAVIDPAG